MDRTIKTLGIYIHIPFCASKCAYCDFYSLAGCDDSMPEYQSALLQHIEEAHSQLDGYYIDTVYFGGGTPSYYGAARLIEIFDALKKNGHVMLDAEVTLEVNPDSITLQDLQKLRKAGFNRLSIGVQTDDDGTLKSIGRRHNFAQAEQTVANGRMAGFDNISVDLIYGLPSQTREGWAETLKHVAALKPEHISCYGLKIEEGTPLYMFKDSPFIPDDDAQADMYLYAVEALERFGYHQYEISNFAMRGCESKHNLKYWTGQEYFGIGAAAHSYMGGQRFSFISDVKKYCERVADGSRIVDHSEYITQFEQAGEYLMLFLRTTIGITEREYEAIYPCDFTPIQELFKIYEQRGWAVYNNDRWSFTPQGFLLSNTLISNALEAQTRQRVYEGTPWKKDEESVRAAQYTMFDNPVKDIRLFNGIS